MDQGHFPNILHIRRTCAKCEGTRVRSGRQPLLIANKSCPKLLMMKCATPLDEYEKLPRKCKIQTTIHECRHFYVTDFLEHAPATASIAISESTLDPNKNIQQGLSGPNEFNVKREIRHDASICFLQHSERPAIIHTDSLRHRN
jgi:hypothetical protein